MINKKLLILNKLGLHARAAAKFVAHASRYLSQIQVTRPGIIANGKNIIEVMSLGATQGTEIRLIIQGDDEIAALQALQALIENRFGEKE